MIFFFTKIKRIKEALVMTEFGLQKQLVLVINIGLFFFFFWYLNYIKSSSHHQPTDFRCNSIGYCNQVMTQNFPVHVIWFLKMNFKYFPHFVHDISVHQVVVRYKWIHIKNPCISSYFIFLFQANFVLTSRTFLKSVHFSIFCWI